MHRTAVLICLLVFCLLVSAQKPRASLHDALNKLNAGGSKSSKSGNKKGARKGGVPDLQNLMQGFLGGDSMASECTYECENGLHKQSRDGHVPESNGCGTGGFFANPKWNFTPCCNEHDKCYHRCGETRKECDDEFLECMLNTCKSVNDAEECTNSARVFHFGGSSFGCATYLQSQEEACECVAEADKKEEL